MTACRNIPFGIQLVAPTAAATMTPGLSQDAATSIEARCLPEDQMASYLRNAWGEEPVISRAPNKSDPLVVYASVRGSWTLVEYRKDGLACVNSSEN